MSGSLLFKPRNQLWVVFVVALALRACFLLHYGPILTNDSDYYLTVARGIQEGHGLGPPYRSPPVYPLFLAAVQTVCESHWAVAVAQAVIGALTCVVIGATCLRLFQARLALLLGLAVALYIPMAAFCVALLRETLIGFGVSLTTYCAVRSLEDQRLRWCWATGGACTFTLFNQATFLFFPFWQWLAYWFHHRSLKAATWRILPLGACFVVALGLWAARNYRVSGHLIPLSADHIGYFFLEGVMDANKSGKALTPAQIRYLGIPADDPYNTYEGMRDYYWGLGKESTQNDLERKLQDGPVLFSRALRLVKHEPLKYLRFSLQRLHRLWLKDLWVQRTDDGYLNLRPLDRWRESRNPAAWFAVVAIYAFGYSSLVGMVLFGRRALGLVVPVVTMLTFHMWVHAETRYALAIHPHLLIFSLLTVVYLWKRWVRRRSSEDIRAAVLL